MLLIILIVIYIVGIIVWMKIEKKYFPYEEGDYTIEFDGAHEITPEIYDCDVQARAMLWPLCLCFIIVLLPFKLIDIIYNNMKQITIEIPDNYELKQDGNTYTIVEKEKKLTYKDITRELFLENDAYYINNIGEIQKSSCYPSNVNNCTSKKQAEKLLAINKLINVAKYLNDGWQPNWNDIKEDKYHITIRDYGIQIHCGAVWNNSIVYFKSEKLANKAIEILGEETIKLALCTDY